MVEIQLVVFIFPFTAIQDINSTRCAGVVMGLNMAIEAIKEQFEEETNESDNH